MKINKNIRMILSVFIAVAMLAVSPCMAASEQEGIPSKTVISQSSAVVENGKTVKLTVKKPDAKVRWKTSNEDIAYVKTVKGKKGQTAVIKAGKKAGVCKITAKVGNKKLTCRVIRLSNSTKDLTATVKADEADRLGASSKFKRSAADFSFELLRKTVETDAAKGKTVNTLISPDSILSALVMTENGAKGKTLTEMQDVLSGGISVDDYNKYLSGMNHRLTSSKNVRYSVANSIWTRNKGIKIRKNFLKKNKTYHNAQVLKAPFNNKTVQDMNNWVSGNTEGMIKKIIDQLDPNDKVVLINAIAFIGNWEEKFSDPVKKDFTTDSGKTKKTDTLCQRERMEYLEVNGGKGFVKYYKGREIAFVGLLPPEGVSVNEYLDGLSGKKYMSAWKSKEYKPLDITVPEFKYDYDTSLKESLQKMGMKRAFSDTANFSGMFVKSSPEQELHIDDVLHKTHIELDKNGTKAAAVTAVIMKDASVIVDDEYIDVHLDRPFVYALVDAKTGIPLFTGIFRGL
ncbi:MAG: serpin family protein [Oscillospiraceae bacterium]|nr:serpin family protein [Oscillospiraceae bacterium]